MGGEPIDLYEPSDLKKFDDANLSNSLARQDAQLKAKEEKDTERRFRDEQRQLKKLVSRGYSFSGGTRHILRGLDNETSVPATPHSTDSVHPETSAAPSTSRPVKGIAGVHNRLEKIETRLDKEDAMLEEILRRLTYAQQVPEGHDEARQRNDTEDFV